MKKVAVCIANGTEEIEFVTVVDILRRAGIKVDMVTINPELLCTGSHDIKIMAEKTIEDIQKEDYDAIVLPGGMPGASHLQHDERLIKIIREWNREDKLICAICAAPIVLATADVIKKKDFTCYPGFEDVIKISGGKHLQEDVVISQNIITGKGPAFAIKFALTIIEKLINREKQEEIAKNLLII